MLDQVVTYVDTTADAAPDPSYVPPSNFALGEPSIYYDISSNATYSGQIEVCLTYPAGSFPPGAVPRLYHYTAADRWVDVTTRVDTANRVVCGTVVSLSPFALGYAIVTPGVLRVKKLKLHERQAGAKKRMDAWAFIGVVNAGSATDNALVLRSILTTGAAFNIDGRLGLIDSVVFGPGGCGFKRQHRRKPLLVCADAGGNSRVSVTARKSKLLLDAKFKHRAFNLSAPLNALGPFEVQIATSSSLGTLTAPLQGYKASAHKLRR